MSKYRPGEIMKDEEKQSHFCCLHKNLVPLEVNYANKTYPNGYQSEPNYNFAVSIVSANVSRVKSYLCLDCKQEIKAPNPDSIKKDRL